MRCAEAVAGLRDRGHEVSVLTSIYRAGPSCEPHLERCLHFHGGPPYPPEDAEGFIRAELADVRSVMQAIRAFRADLVSVWGMEFCSQNIPAAATRGAVPCVFQIEDVWLCDGAQRDLWMNLLRALPDPVAWQSVTPALARCLQAPVDRLALPYGTTVLFASQAMRENYARAGWTHPHTAVYWGGIDVRRYFHFVRSERPRGTWKILYVGQVTRERGVEDLLEAVRILGGRPSVGAIECKVCGPVAGVFRDELARLARNLPGDATIDFAGPLGPDQLRSAYHASHVLVHPSRLREGLPRVIQEGLCAGLVVVATDTGGQKDLLGQGRYGYLTRPGDPAGLAATLASVFADWQEAAARAAAGQDFMRREFSTQRMVDRLEQFACETCARHERPNGRDAPHKASDEVPADRAESEIPALVSYLRQVLVTRIVPGAETLGPEQLWRAGSLAKRLACFDEAQRLLRRLRDLGRDDAAHLRRSEFHLAELELLRADWQRAGEHLERCLAVAPEHAKAIYYRQHLAERTMPPNLESLARTARR